MKEMKKEKSHLFLNMFFVFYISFSFILTRRVMPSRKAPEELQHAEGERSMLDDMKARTKEMEEKFNSRYSKFKKNTQRKF